jgi:hypothetical protein
MASLSQGAQLQNIEKWKVSPLLSQENEEMYYQAWSSENSFQI